MTPKEKAEELIYEFIEKDLVKTFSGLAKWLNPMLNRINKLKN